MSSRETVLVWSIAAGAIAGVIFRPREWPEAVWACLGAFFLVVLGLLPTGPALGAVAKGSDVYFFLSGMMLLAELARREGLFDWLAALAVQAAKGSQARLFTLLYIVGVLVTVFLSNDATAVVLTPAVYAAVKKARADVLTYLFICAFIANAASFVLPISNPANLVVYGKTCLRSRRGYELSWRHRPARLPQPMLGCDGSCGGRFAARSQPSPTCRSSL